MFKVSHFHFYKAQLNFQVFFELFKQDTMMYGSWINHCIACWKLRYDPNVLILRYEEIKNDPTAQLDLERIARSCEKNLSDDQIQSILEHTFVDNMKPSSINARPKPDSFIRKCKVRVKELVHRGPVGIMCG